MNDGMPTGGMKDICDRESGFYYGHENRFNNSPYAVFGKLGA